RSRPRRAAARGAARPALSAVRCSWPRPSRVATGAAPRGQPGSLPDAKLFHDRSLPGVRGLLTANLTRILRLVAVPAVPAATVADQVLFSASVAPGRSAPWTASFQVSTQGISSFGVYPVTAQLQDLSGTVISSEQTLLPFWPGSRTAGLASPLKISWLWPLI